VFTIVGAGFGLYGYLPAIVGVLQTKVLLSERYRQTIESRPELGQYVGHIEWCPSISLALSQATGAVIAIPPMSQKGLVEQILSIDSIEKLIIEKPICPTPSDSSALMDALLAKSKRFRVGYSFLYTDWYRELKEHLHKPAAQLRITWSFKADHFVRNRETWKRYHSLGGGALRFYGIHILAALASLGYEETTSNLLAGTLADQPDAWKAQFSGLKVPLCTVHLSTNSDRNDFHIEVGESEGNMRSIHREASPFALSKISSGQDSRVPVLERLIQSFEYSDDQHTALYRATNDLWARTE
jgi:predicted dehydrogenase